MTVLVLLAVLSRPGPADEDAKAAGTEVPDAARSARSSALIGPNCAFATSTMARRALAEGTDYSYLGAIEKAPDDAGNDVACPYRLAPDARTCVVANEVVERLSSEGLVGVGLGLQGKVLELDAVRYVVLVSYRPTNH